MRIDQLMTRNVSTCTRHDVLARAAQIMWEHDCGIVPVVDDGGVVVGMITDRDICMAAYLQGRTLSEIPVGIAASHVVYAVHPSDSPQTAEKVMQEHQVRRLAVIDDDGRLVGVLSLNDLARHAGHRAYDVGTDEVARTLAAISMPPQVAQPVASN